MNQAQRDHTKETIANYQQEINRLYYKINQNAMFAFLGTSLAITIFAIEQEQEALNESLKNLLGILSGASTVINATCCVKKIVKRELLEQDVRNMEYNLKIDELDKPKELIKK